MKDLEIITGILKENFKEDRRGTIIDCLLSIFIGAVSYALIFIASI